MNGDASVNVESNAYNGGTVTLSIRPEFGQEMRFSFFGDGGGLVNYQNIPLNSAGAGRILDGFATVLSMLGRQHAPPMPTNWQQPPKVIYAMRTCSLCGFRADMFCLDCKQAFCFQHTVVTREAWGYQCDSPDGHAFVPILQKGSNNPMKSTSPEQAQKEGTKFGRLMRSVFTVAPDVQFKDVSDLAQYFAMDVLGYRDGEIVIAWVQEFIAALMQTETPEELKEKFTVGDLTMEQFDKLITRAIAAPKPPEGAEN